MHYPIKFYYVRL